MTQANLAVVVIGRNEGDRLRTCLKSAKRSPACTAVVYVDSGSTDQSVTLAQDLGCEVVTLDLTQPFTAARARMEGFERALQITPNLDYVQFVDGDCELVTQWMEVAVDFLRQHPDAAAACGRRRERYPQRSIFNQLCDMEWNSKIGKARYCGGDVVLRVQALREVSGYRVDLIAGEEPELCVRLRAKGWSIWRLDHEMTLHDAAMTRLGQWWKRSKRAGYAFAQGADLHGAPPERHWVKEVRGAVVWGLGIPTLVLLLALLNPLFLLLLLIYPLQVVRIALGGDYHGTIAWWRAGFLVMGKFAEVHGILTFWSNKWRRKSAALIEYK
jgi:glycosyltransferase involved in cell wall biosynthesis